MNYETIYDNVHIVISKSDEIIFEEFQRVWSQSICVGSHSTLGGYDIFCPKNMYETRNSLDCDQSNCSSRIVFSDIPFKFGQTGISAILSADPENPTVEPNMKCIGRPLAEIWPFEISQMWGRRWSSVIGRRSVVNIYFFLHWSHSLR